MPIPGLTDIYEFSDWLKKNYVGGSRCGLSIAPIQGGLIEVKESNFLDFPDLDQEECNLIGAAWLEHIKCP